MKNNRCIDAGRPGSCPCALAEHGNCLICSRINGGSCEDCSWQGSCIYSLYEQDGRRVIEGRKAQELPIAEIKSYSSSFKVFVLQADRGFCQKAQTAGAFVFVRRPEDESWYDAPVSVLKAEPDTGLLHLGICRCGAKTDALLQTEKSLCVRGIYYNGLSGIGGLSEEAEETFVYAKGIAAAPLRNFLDGGDRYTKWLKNLHLYIDPDKTGFDFFRDYFGDLPVSAIEVRSFAEEGISSPDDLDRMEENRQNNNVFALTSPYYAAQIQRAAGGSAVRPTEGNMCCGEGVCGACTCVDELGRTVRRCKVKE